MASMYIYLFDKLSIRFDRQITLSLQPRRAAELLCYLLLYRNRLHEREKLATLLWPESNPVQSRRYLRQTLWELQAGMKHIALDSTGQPCARLLDVENDRMGINSYTEYWLDIAVFEEAYAVVENKPGRDLSPEQAEQLRLAVQLYSGNLLEGWYQDWCILERDRLQNIYLAMLDKLLAYSATQYAYGTGLTYGAEILRYDRAREQTHRQLMWLYCMAGNRTAALRQFDLCAAALHEELGVEPSPGTINLYQQICNPQADLSSLTFDAGSGSIGRAAEQPTDTLQQLEHIQAVLFKLQVQIAHLSQNLKQGNLHKS